MNSVMIGFIIHLPEFSVKKLKNKLRNSQSTTAIVSIVDIYIVFNWFV